MRYGERKNDTVQADIYCSKRWKSIIGVQKLRVLPLSLKFKILKVIIIETEVCYYDWREWQSGIAGQI